MDCLSTATVRFIFPLFTSCSLGQQLLLHSSYFPRASTRENMAIAGVIFGWGNMSWTTEQQVALFRFMTDWQSIFYMYCLATDQSRLYKAATDCSVTTRIKEELDKDYLEVRSSWKITKRGHWHVG